MNRIKMYSAKYVRERRLVIGVYRIKSPVSENCYVGSSHNVHGRIWFHLRQLRRKKHHSSVLQRAFNKYGEALQVEVLWTYSVAQYERYPERLRNKEQEFMDDLPALYNGTRTVRSPSLDPRVGRRISQAKMGHVHSEAAKKNMSAAAIARGCCLTPEGREKVGWAKGIKKNRETHARMLIAQAEQGVFTNAEVAHIRRNVDPRHTWKSCEIVAKQLHAKTHTVYRAAIGKSYPLVKVKPVNVIRNYKKNNLHWLKETGPC